MQLDELTWDIPLGTRVVVKSLSGTAAPSKIFGTVVAHGTDCTPKGSMIPGVGLVESDRYTPVYGVRTDLVISNMEAWTVYRNEIEPTVTERIAAACRAG